MSDQPILDALKLLTKWAEDQLCSHEQTHRGGAIWEVCDRCGAKWADDEGGKPEFKWPAEIESARGILAAANATPQVAQQEGAQGDFEELLGRYWMLAFSEGKSGISHGDEANDVLHKLRNLFRSSAPQPQNDTQESNQS